MTAHLHHLVLFLRGRKVAERDEYLDASDEKRLRELLEGFAEAEHKSGKLDLSEYRLDVHSAGFFGRRIARVSVDPSGRLKVKR